ncbi:MAG: hypothetical protein ACI9SC_002569 [Gammaproteobacteria bacterium]|jgi:hypothetical protein
MLKDKNYLANIDINALFLTIIILNQRLYEI